MNLNLDEQRVLVMGGSSGIGLASAHAALALGARVTITGRDQRKLDAALAQLGERASAASVDAGRREQLAGFLERTGRIDHLVLALGGGAGAGPIASLELADLRAGFEGKPLAHLSALQLALPQLAPAASVTFVSAASAGAPYAGVAGLAAINGALEAMVPALAVELAPIRVNAVSPGVIDTPWWHGMPEAERQAAFAQYGGAAPVGRVGQAGEVAQAILSVICNGFITGTVVTVDGGLRFRAAA
ncbi:MAG TPA: SDR family oxidoreductase [Solirubrobacteraceae bacterium]|nr:SDR family oxidoreductase [Solirubrobacteraceae bacterium]